MIRNITKPVPRAKPQTDKIHPVGIPFKGLNTVSPYGSMTEGDAISLNNVIVESYGLRTRKGYTAWATGFPDNTPINSILNYYPSTYDANQSFKLGSLNYQDMAGHMMVSPRSALGPGPGTIFAAQGTKLYDVTAGGPGPWVAEVGVTGASDTWVGVNYQNVAGQFLLIANEAGGYAIYDGTSWFTPVAGIGPTNIDGVDPTKICWVTTWKERVWFFVKDSTVGYYLPPGQLTGKATAFDFGTQMDHGGSLSFLGGWTVDGGIGTDDYLVAIGSQGDVVIYKGTDPNDISSFALHGVWYSGPLPVGLRAVDGGGGDISILTQFGVVSVSNLLKVSTEAAQMKAHLSKNVDPLVAALMRDYSTLKGWQLITLAKEELTLVRAPPLLTSYIQNSFLAFKTTTEAWSVLSDLPYAHIVNTGSVAYAGTMFGTVVRAFDGSIDNVGLDGVGGNGIRCRVTPAYSALGSPGLNKHIKMIRPFFIAVAAPYIEFTVLTNYEPPVSVFIPSIVQGDFGGIWDVSKWNIGKWGGGVTSIHYWYGCTGWGHAVTVQLDYTTGGDTVLMGLDYWLGVGGVM